MFIDPNATDAAIKLGVSLAEVTAKNSVSYVINKREKAKANKDRELVIREYDELIDKLIDDNREFDQIARSYKALYEQIEILLSWQRDFGQAIL
ncbi:hypothetical protein WAX74_15075 [Psychrobacillus sp. FJAT-51614]|uniref:Uncharacterized protein n=1 Tax=Psychrobacillus mangrovi TaxID=3117745 RepID=A0ABU8F7F1_9BACI